MSYPQICALLGRICLTAVGAFVVFIVTDLAIETARIDKTDYYWSQTLKGMLGQPRSAVIAAFQKHHLNYQNTDRQFEFEISRAPAGYSTLGVNIIGMTSDPSVDVPPGWMMDIDVRFDKRGRLDRYRVLHWHDGP